MRRFVLYILPVVAYAGVIFLLSSRSSLPAPAVVGFDKVAHFGVYGGLAFLAARGAHGYGSTRLRAAVLGALLAAAYGATDEVHQSFVPGRTMELLDLAADALGAAAGAFTWRLWARWHAQRRSQRQTRRQSPRAEKDAPT